MNITFITVLYAETNDVRRSKYLDVYTIANNICDFPDIPVNKFIEVLVSFPTYNGIN